MTRGDYGGMLFAALTWKRVGGMPGPAFKHPGDMTYPFKAPSTEQLHYACLLWKRGGGSWGAVGASCSKSLLAP